MDEGNEAQPPATAVARQHVESEAAAHEVRPWAAPRRGCRVQRRLDCRGRCLTGSSARHNRPTPRRPRAQHAVIEEQIHPAGAAPARPGVPGSRRRGTGRGPRPAGSAAGAAVSAPIAGSAHRAGRHRPVGRHAPPSVARHRSGRILALCTRTPRAAPCRNSHTGSGQSRRRASRSAGSCGTRPQRRLGDRRRPASTPRPHGTSTIAPCHKPGFTCSTRAGSLASPALSK